MSKTASKHVSAAAHRGQDHASGHDASSHHISPVSTYLAVYAALLVMTALTVIVSIADLGPISIYAAMGIAVVKATAVALYFMHLKYDEKLNSLVLASSVVFLALFFGFTMLDLTTRGSILPDTDNFVMKPELLEKDAAARAQYLSQERDGHGTAH
jgi:cytochrome c oxidase subunit 4